MAIQTGEIRFSLKSFLIAVFVTGPFLCWAEFKGVSFSDSEAISGIVRPIVHELGKNRRVRSTGHERIDHAEQLTVSLHDSLILDLKLNKDLIPEDFYVLHHVNGKENSWRPEGSSDNRSLFCHYRGVVRNASNSWTTLSTCSGFSGVVFDGSQLYSIEPLAGTTTLQGEHSWAKHSQLENSNKSFHCHEGSPSPEQVDKHRPKRMAHQREVAMGSKIVELVLVVDYAIHRRNNGDMRRIVKRVLDIANVIREVYLPLGVSIVLVGVIVWSEGDQIGLQRGDSSATLSNFKQYRNAHLGIKTHDNAQLMTGVETGFFGASVGHAYVDTLCRHHDSCGIAMDIHENTPALTASFIAHEMGHNFGMRHDTDHCQCISKNCVMVSAMGSIPTTEWSSCSKELIRNHTRYGKYDCLKNQPSSRCGNMVLDPGEDCDCGTPFFCRNRCCNPKTCKFVERTGLPKAECADGDCCNLQTCMFESAGVECRPVQHECDLSEHCNGMSKICPADLFKYNGASCYSKRAPRIGQICINKECKNNPHFTGKKIPTTSPFPACPTNCTKNGQCNNLGKCHCSKGYDPRTNCQLLGRGGSEDGGPSSDPRGVNYDKFELYLLFLGILPITAFLFFCFYFYLDETEKSYFWACVRNPKKWCTFGGGERFFKGFTGRLPVPLIHSNSVDKPGEGVEKRDFKDWVRNRVRLTLPSINIPPVNGGSSALSPMSGFSTATTMSAINTPDELLATPIGFATTPVNDKKLLLTPPVQRLRPAPPPPTPPKPRKQFAVSNQALEIEDETQIMSTTVKQGPRPFSPPPPPPPPSAAKPRLT